MENASFMFNPSYAISSGPTASQLETTEPYVTTNLIYSYDCPQIFNTSIAKWSTKPMWTLTWRHLQRLQSPLHCLWRWRWSLHLQALRVQVSLRSRQHPHPAHLRNIMETTCYYSSHRALKSCECIEQIFMILSKISGWTEPWLFFILFLVTCF